MTAKLLTDALTTTDEFSFPAVPCGRPWLFGVSVTTNGTAYLGYTEGATFRYFLDGSGAQVAVTSAEGRKDVEVRFPVNCVPAVKFTTTGGSASAFLTEVTR
jgi:hypothetical protein